MKLYCVTCKCRTEMDYDSECQNFICLYCDKLLVGKYGHEILEVDDGDLNLYITKDMFIFLLQKRYFKLLMKLYDGRIWISTEE